MSLLKSFWSICKVIYNGFVKHPFITSVSLTIAIFLFYLYWASIYSFVSSLFFDSFEDRQIQISVPRTVTGLTIGQDFYFIGSKIGKIEKIEKSDDVAEPVFVKISIEPETVLLNLLPWQYISKNSIFAFGETALNPPPAKYTIPDSLREIANSISKLGNQRCVNQISCGNLDSTADLFNKIDSIFVNINEIKGVVESTKTVVDETKESVDNTKTLLDDTKEAVDNTKIVVDSTKTLLDDTKEAVDNTKIVVDSTKTLLDDTKESVDNTKIVVDNTKTLLDDTKESVDNTKIVVDNTKTLLDDTKDAVDNTKIAVDNTETLLDDTKDVVDNTKIAVDNTKTLLDDTKDAVDDTKIAVDNTKTVVDEVKVVTTNKFGLIETLISSVQKLSEQHDVISEKISKLPDITIPEELATMHLKINDILTEIDNLLKFHEYDITHEEILQKLLAELQKISTKVSDIQIYVAQNNTLLESDQELSIVEFDSTMKLMEQFNQTLDILTRKISNLDTLPERDYFNQSPVPLYNEEPK